MVYASRDEIYVLGDSTNGLKWSRRTWKTFQDRKLEKNDVFDFIDGEQVRDVEDWRYCGRKCIPYYDSRGQLGRRSWDESTLKQICEGIVIHCERSLDDLVLDPEYERLTQMRQGDCNLATFNMAFAAQARKVSFTKTMDSLTSCGTPEYETSKEVQTMYLNALNELNREMIRQVDHVDFKTLTQLLEASLVVALKDSPVKHELADSMHKTKVTSKVALGRRDRNSLR